MQGLNQALFESIFGLTGRSAMFDGVMVFLAVSLPYFLILGFLALIFSTSKNWRRRLFFLSVSLLTTMVSRGIFTEAIKSFYPHGRPPQELGIKALVTVPLDSSFPSGHAAVFFALAGALFFFKRNWGLFYFFLALVNGVARVFVGVHWPLDIVGGICVGIISAILVHELVSVYGEKLELPPS